MLLHRLPQASLCACALELTILSAIRLLWKWGRTDRVRERFAKQFTDITHSAPSHKIRAIARAQHRDNGHRAMEKDVLLMAHPPLFGVSDQRTSQYRPTG
jgi:hypothetical protein